jgi:hypothetical protein
MDKDYESKINKIQTQIILDKPVGITEKKVYVNYGIYQTTSDSHFF